MRFKKDCIKIALLMACIVVGCFSVPISVAGSDAKKGFVSDDGLLSKVELEYKRAVFSEARKAHKKNHYRTFKKLSAQLTDYPLYDYLTYGYLRNNFGNVKDKDIQSFIRENEGDILGEYMRDGWLIYLAKKHRWEEFLRAYDSKGSESSTVLMCYKSRALLNTGRIKSGLSLSKDLWMTGSSRPKECDPAFAELYNRGKITTKDLWQRIDLVMDKGNLRLAKYLSKKLSKKDKNKFARWEAMYRNPSRALKKVYKWKNTDFNRKVIVYGIKRLARKDSALALAEWEKLESKIVLSSSQRNEVASRIALSAALQYKDNALELMWAIPIDKKSDLLKEWTIRTALRKQDWQSVLRAIGQLDEAQKKMPEWVYWEARALGQTGESERAIKKMKSLANQRRYYGFLAADMLGQSYRMNHSPVEVEHIGIDSLMKNKALLRARELKAVGMNRWARREVSFAIRDMSEKEKQAVAQLALQWGWYDLSIRIASNSGASDDLDLRFPMPYKDEVDTAVTKYNLDSAWIMGVLRRESAFREDARSSVGALGLMQVMPATGRFVAKRTKTRLRRSSDLLNASKNIKIGSAYLSILMDKFDENKVLATAAYNAGPSNVWRWMPSDSPMPADVWIDTIPFKETRAYTRAVLSFAVVFDWKINGKASSIGIDNKVIPLADQT